MSVLPLPPLHTDAPFVVLSDWDGTITNTDSNDYLTDNLGFGKQKRRELNTSCLMGHIGFRDSFRQMLESVKIPFPECAQILRENVRLDPGFKNFYAYCKENKIPVIIVSSGMTPLIRAVLSNLIGEEEASKIEIIANDVKFTDEKQQGDTWEIVFRHPESEFGHDKSKAILPYANLPNPPTTFFMGDGVSDLSAASHADMLFVKDKGAENDLRAYCMSKASWRTKNLSLS
ncbi:-diketo-5-methylthio-1-phosphopentane phosphatase [Phaffia rhodozyma]|uniref:-diketo-5-methylthio-1-phosphopentane phosphatase n=1 Tax=Phaffia rhodozyma TaxID=264483 RepID=A0A0F7SY36_PHARH|nr:-diketo-5-methylthio-1-phosphopentane phosphatase [Phaffia rhodozyma]